MKDYITCSYVQAQPITRGDYNSLQGWVLPENENGNDEGYLVWRGKKHCCWIPKDIFERESLELPEKNYSCSLVNMDIVNKLIRSTHVEVFNEHITYMTCHLINGLSFDTVQLCNEAYDFEREKQKCFDQIILQIAENLEFLVTTALEGFGE